jgi:DNA-binding NtrC family response regulator
LQESKKGFPVLTLPASTKRPVILTYLDAKDLNSAELFHKLKEEGFDYHELPTPEQPAARLSSVPFAAVLVFSQFDQTRIDKALQMTKTAGEYLRKQGGNSRHVICCGIDLLPNYETDLRECGANKIVQPESWKARAVADRLLAALFGGFDTFHEGVKEAAFVEFNEKPKIKCRVPFKGASVTRKIVGATKIMREMFAEIEVYCSSPDPVLIRGETGTGKELVAAAIHSTNEANESKTYVPINIAEIPPDVLPSELFGHRKGAFSGAHTERKGLLVEAGDGTVFIDEIGDLDKNNQARLLRVFANREIRPVGAEHARTVAFNARLIFATHQPLEDLCAKGEFRQDLYQRIREGHTIRLPSLSERKGDLELLAKEFFREWCEDRSAHKDVLALQQSDYDKIVDLCIKHDFPGNVRQLRGILRGCFNLSLKDKTFNIGRLKRELEIDIDLTSRERSGAGGEAVISSTLSLVSVTFDPNEDTFEEFLPRARTIYFTEVYRASGGRPDVAISVAGVVKKTFYKYCTRKQRQEVLRAIRKKRTTNSD